MEGYELTDRGKIVLTLLLVLLLLILPSIVFTFCALTNQQEKAPDDQDAQISDILPSATPAPVIAESPPPNGGGFSPPEASPPDGGSGPGETGPTDGQSPARPPGPGQSSVDPIEGTLSFFFSPETQGPLDAETAYMLDEFLGSPKNTRESIIAVETPQLSFGVFEEFAALIAGALDSRGVEESRVAYITDPEAPLAEGGFEVNMSYASRRAK